MTSETPLLKEQQEQALKLASQAQDLASKAEEGLKMADNVKKQVSFFSKPEEPEAQLAPRKAFSRLRCLWNPFVAEDPKLCEPFAKLTIKVVRAEGLLSNDLFGWSNPYVSLNLDSDEECFRTATMRQTNDPVYNETFTIDIYNPISILTLTVMDQEWGAGDIADMLGLGDIMAGWVDIRLGALPMNEWVCGYFDLGHPEAYKETIKGRIEDKTLEDHVGGCGSLYLKVHLGTMYPRSEIFALCLPLPDLGHACHLDMADLLHDVLALSKFADKWNKDVFADIERVLHYATFVYLSALGLVWWPPSIVPALTVIGPLAAIYMSLKFEVPSTRAAKAKAQALSLVESEDKAEEAAKVVDVSQAESNPLDDVEPALRSMVKLLPKHAAKEIRKAAANVEWSVGGVEAIEKLAEMRVAFGFSTVFLVTAAILGSVPVAIAAVWFREYQTLLLQIGATIFVTYWLWTYSLIGRVVNGAGYWLVAHWRIRHRMSHLAHEVDPDDPSKVRSLEKHHLKHLKLHSKGKHEEAHHEKDPSVLLEQQEDVGCLSCVGGRPR